MRRFRALIKKEMTHMMRDPRTLVFIFLMPIMQLVLLGYINTTEIRHVPTVVFNQDNDKASRDLLDSFDATDYFSFDYFCQQPGRSLSSDRRRQGQGRHHHPA